MRLFSMIAASVLVSSIVVVGASNARADETMPSSEWQVHSAMTPPVTDATTAVASPRTETHWYGWQNLTVDAAAVVMFVGAGSSNSSTLGYMGLGTYLAGSGIVHLGHERVGAAIGSVLLRAATPIVGGMIGAATSSCHDNEDDEFCQFGAIAVGVLAGAVVAIVIDDAALANEEVPTTGEGPRLLPTAGVVPSRDNRSFTPTFGVAGVF
jgi:hypothetical protein